MPQVPDKSLQQERLNPLNSGRVQATRDNSGNELGKVISNLGSSLDQQISALNKAEDDAAVNEALTGAYERLRTENNIYEKDNERNPETSFATTGISINNRGIDASGNSSNSITGTDRNLPPYMALYWIIRIK